MSTQRQTRKLPQYAMESDEGVRYLPVIRFVEGPAGLEYLEVSVQVTLPDGTQHDVTFTPSTFTGEGEGTGNVFVYEDDDAITHFAWSGPSEEDQDDTTP